MRCPLYETVWSAAQHSVLASAWESFGRSTRSQRHSRHSCRLAASDDMPGKLAPLQAGNSMPAWTPNSEAKLATQALTIPGAPVQAPNTTTAL